MENNMVFWKNFLKYVTQTCDVQMFLDAMWED
jgi:hypothetical protein